MRAQRPRRYARTSSLSSGLAALVATAKARRILKKGQRLRVSYLAESLGKLSAAEVRLLQKAAELIERMLSNAR